MAMTRQPRTDRRRRVLREAFGHAFDQALAQPTRAGGADAAKSASATRKPAGYSQEVRRACGQRLVQLIPVRRRSFFAVLWISCLIPGLLLAAHYMIYVNGSLPWYGHPLAIALDASHPQSVAAWLSSQLWILCLLATILTFQLRRHKLDDYKGEYRLWFWMIITCLIASLESTSHLTDLFGVALDHWSQTQLGWSGPAVVSATLAVLVGMLGVRLCAELKAVPLSLAFWLCGLLSWAASTALAQPEFQLEMSIQLRIWLRFTLWIGGLTCIWLASLTYLRTIYIEAQRRFVERRRLATRANQPLAQRLRQSLREMPKPRWPGRRTAEGEQVDQHSNFQGEDDQSARRRWGWLKPRRDDPGSEATSDNGPAKASESGKSPQRSKSQAAPPSTANPQSAAKGTHESAAKGTHESGGGHNAPESSSQPRGRMAALTGWLRQPKDSDDPEEFRKVRSKQSGSHASDSKTKPKSTQQPPRDKSSRNQDDTESVTADDSGADKKSRKWRPTIGRPRIPKIGLPKIPKPRLPRLGLGSLRLKPPGEEAEQSTAGSSSGKSHDEKPRFPNSSNHASQAEDRKSNQSRGAVKASDASTAGDSREDSVDDNSRPLTKAERKRLRRQRQQQNRAA